MTPIEKANADSGELSSRDWWLGVTEMLGHGVHEGTQRIERAHLAIAEEAFRILRDIPMISATSEQVKQAHHLIAHAAYAGVAGAGRLLALASRHLTSGDAGNRRETVLPPPADSECDRHH